MAHKRPRQAFEADLPAQTSPFVLYGTALPPLDDNTRDDGSFVPVWKQEVRDERGRKRLHGAFTGGFSAGYFNTVGSKEGWTPSAFVSSRQNRAKDQKSAATQRPEDFMDDEDLEEAEEARKLQTSAEFAGFGTESDIKRKAGVVDIFTPTGETMGTKLLKKMGWKEGQGIGPRVRRAANLEEHGTSVETHLFAPDDVQIMSLGRKNDYKGLGYEGELDQSASSSAPQPRQARHDDHGESDEEDDPMMRFRLAKNGRKQVSKSQKSAFGVGVLNDSDDDDDPYSMGPRISYTRVIGGEKKAKKKPQVGLGTANPLLKTKPAFVSKRLASLKGALRKCHDGRLPLDGFVLGDELVSFSSMSLTDEKYRPPEVPPEWKSSLKQEPADEGATYISTGDAAKASLHTAKSRASILGEAQLPGKSVFDFMSPAARDRLAQASGNTNLPQALNEPPPPGHESHRTPASLHSLVPELDTQTALQALNRGAGGFMPYAEDPAKRSRYRAYLEIQAGLQLSGELPPRAEGMKQEDWVLEMHEFARAAQVFKPVSGLMASRFTSGSTQIASQNPDTDAPDLLFKPKEKPTDPAVEAARMGMFGPMTRITLTFAPTRLLCKRFGVPMPDLSASRQMEESSGGASFQPVFRSFASGGVQHEEAPQSALVVKDKEAEALPLPAVTLEEDEAGLIAHKPVPVDPDRNEALEKERPGEAVFKAIFGDSDDESS